MILLRRLGRTVEARQIEAALTRRCPDFLLRMRPVAEKRA